MVAAALHRTRGLGKNTTVMIEIWKRSDLGPKAQPTRSAANNRDEPCGRTCDVVRLQRRSPGFDFEEKKKGGRLLCRPRVSINDFYSDQNVTDILTNAVRPMMS